MSNYLDSDWPILIVEDDQPTAELEAKVLKRAGKSSRTVVGVDDAITALAIGRFSAVLLDYLLADENGWKVLEAASASSPPVPVIIVTGHGNEEVAVEALRRGAADYVIKNGAYWEHLPSLVERVVKTSQAQHLRSALTTALEMSDDAIIGIDEHRRIVNWNQGAARIFGRPGAAVLGQSVLNLFPHDKHAVLERAFEKLSAGGRVDCFETLAHPEISTTVYLSVALSPILNEHKRIIGISITARDISARKQAEELLKRTEFQLRQLQRLEAVREIAGGVAHEFNNLLTVIIVRSELMLQHLAHDPRMTAEVQLIIKTSDRAAAVARQLLAFSGQQFLRPKVVDLNTAVQDVESAVKQIVGTDITVVTQLGTNPGHVKADPAKIEEVLLNLAMNAKDAMPNGGRLIFETATVVKDEAFARANEGVSPGLYTMLSVTDTGCGMDTGTLARIFEPFFTTKGRAKRTGLGLAMVYGTIKQSGGFIHVSSEVGQGARFEIYLPCIDVPFTPARPSARTAAQLTIVKTILVVEDTFEVLDIIKETLGTCGYNLLTASHPREAIELVEKHSGKIDLLLTDVVMPEMNGTELAIRLEALQPAMKVIYMSGYPESHLGTNGNAEIHFIPKPLSLHVLISKVHDVISS